MNVDVLIGLVLGGLILLLAEVFVPGGVVGSIGIALMVVGIIAGFLKDRTLGFELLVGGVVGGLIALWVWLKYFPRSPVGRRLILQTSEEDWQGYDGSTSDLLGKTGVAHTPLRPAGIALIAGRRVDVVTSGEMIRRGRPVRVVEVEGNRIMVQEVVEETESGSGSAAGQGNAAGEADFRQNKES